MQKSVLRDSVNELSLHYLAKKKIMICTDVERNDIPFICKTLGCTPIAHIDGLKPGKLGKAEMVAYETQSDGNKVLKITGLAHKSRTVSILIRGSNNLVNFSNPYLLYRLLMKLKDLSMTLSVLLDVLLKTVV